MKNILVKIYSYVSEHIDRICHACISYLLVISYAFIISLDHFYIGIIGTLVLGIFKEILDLCTYGTADIKDLLADIVGVLIATAVCMVKLLIL